MSESFNNSLILKSMSSNTIAEIVYNISPIYKKYATAIIENGVNGEVVYIYKDNMRELIEELEITDKLHQTTLTAELNKLVSSYKNQDASTAKNESGIKSTIVKSDSLENIVEEDSSMVMCAKIQNGEDYIGKAEGPNGVKVKFVIDGHGGAETAEYIADEGPAEIVKQIEKQISNRSKENISEEEIQKIVQSVATQLNSKTLILRGGAVFSGFIIVPQSDGKFVVPCWLGDCALRICQNDKIEQSEAHVARNNPQNKEYKRIMVSDDATVVLGEDRSKADAWYRSVLYEHGLIDRKCSAKDMGNIKWAKLAFEKITPERARKIVNRWSNEPDELYVKDKCTGQRLQPTRSLGDGINGKRMSGILDKVEFLKARHTRDGAISISLSTDGAEDVWTGPAWVFADAINPSFYIDEILRKISNKIITPIIGTRLLMELAKRGWTEHHMLSIAVERKGWQEADDIGIHTELIE